jgi:sulfoxide reductase catalytic subunit YedY
MLIRRPPDIQESEVTDEKLYVDRRRFLRTAAVAGAGLGLAAVTPGLIGRGGSLLAGVPQEDKLTPYEDVTTYNNFYEFGTGKGDPAKNAHTLRPRPWTVAVEGECSKPGLIDIEDILKRHAAEERIYRLRCVEAWSM